MVIEEIEKGLYTFQIVLPENPLRWLNCYVLKGNGTQKNLLIDTGFHRKECFDALTEGMKALDLTPDNTDILFTHMHSDHTGNGGELWQMGYHILMGEKDYVFMVGTPAKIWEMRGHILGMNEQEIYNICYENPAINYAPTHFEAETIKDGQLLHYGGRTLESILVPGHTPGNMVFYDRENKVMFTGDHILFNISPNIVSWTGYDDSLGNYMDNLLKMKDYDIRLALPAHRGTGDKTISERVDELIEHHMNRLSETMEVLMKNPGYCANEVAAYLTWNIRSRDWGKFPAGQRWFAVGETMAHLQFLTKRGHLEMRPDDNGIFRYYPVEEFRR